MYLTAIYWPTIYRDVAEYCWTCGSCQKRLLNIILQPAPLISLPIIDTPFKRVAMDIVGPLPCIRSGKRYILVLCDYPTHYPEAAALRSLDAEHIAEERTDSWNILIKLWDKLLPYLLFIVGPLPRSRLEKRYILVLYDYAT